MRSLAVALLLLASPAAAQVPTVYHFDLTAQEIDEIGTALGDRPLKEALPLYLKLQGAVKEQQLQAQHPPKADPVKPDAPTPSQP